MLGLPTMPTRPSESSSAIVVSEPPLPRSIESLMSNVSGSKSDAVKATCPRRLIAGHEPRKRLSLPLAIVV